MNKNILSEVSRMKEIMGLINEQMVARNQEEAKEKGIIVPDGCPDGECFFYFDGGNSENGRLYKKNKHGVIFYASNPTEVLTYLKSSGALGLKKNENFGPNTGTGKSTASQLIPKVLKYALLGKTNSELNKYFPEIQNREDALSTLIIPWETNADKVFYGLPLFSYDDNTVYLDYNDGIDNPPSVKQVTDPRVSDDDTKKN